MLPKVNLKDRKPFNYAKHKTKFNPVTIFSNTQVKVNKELQNYIYREAGDFFS